MMMDGRFLMWRNKLLKLELILPFMSLKEPTVHHHIPPASLTSELPVGILDGVCVVHSGREIDDVIAAQVGGRRHLAA